MLTVTLSIPYFPASLLSHLTKNWWPLKTRKYGNKTPFRTEIGKESIDSNQLNHFSWFCFESWIKNRPFSRLWFESKNRESIFLCLCFESVNQESTFLTSCFESVNQESTFLSLRFESKNQESTFLSLCFESKNQESPFLCHCFESVNQESLFCVTDSKRESWSNWFFDSLPISVSNTAELENTFPLFCSQWVCLSLGVNQS